MQTGGRSRTALYCRKSGDQRELDAVRALDLCSHRSSEANTIRASVPTIEQK